MFSILKPPYEKIQRVLGGQAGQPFTYEGVGATAGSLPAGFELDHERFKIGSGEAAFEKAKAALRQWEQYNLGWIEAYPTDVKGVKLAALPLTKRITAAKDIALVFTLSAGDPGIPAWVQIANGRYGSKLAGGATAVQTPQFLPYVQAGQMIGILGGLKGAAEYEYLVKFKGLATSGMDAQSLSHLVIMLFIVIANLTYLFERIAGPVRPRP